MDYGRNKKIHGFLKKSHNCNPCAQHSNTCPRGLKLKREQGTPHRFPPHPPFLAIYGGCGQQNLWAITKTPPNRVVFFRAPRRSPSCQPADGGCRNRQPGHFLESASLYPPQAALRRFPRRPLQKHHPIGWCFFRAPRRSPSCQPADGGCRNRQPGHFLESASLYPPQAALRRFPRRPLQKEHPIRQDGVFFLEMCRSTAVYARCAGCQTADGVVN